jgi:predicted transcriptional regulator
MVRVHDRIGMREKEILRRIFYYVYIIIHVYMPQGTTVRISRETKAVLDDLKIHKKESYDEVIGRLSHLAYDDEPMTDGELQALKDGLDDIKAGRARSLEEIMKDLGDDTRVKTPGKNGIPG